MINRLVKNQILKHLSHFPAVVLLGARQVGKTTLLKNLLPLIDKPYLYLDLELDSDAFRLSEPELFFKANQDKCIVIDEVQRMPELFPILRGVIDQNRIPGRFILLGSANTHLLKLSSESLAGRVSYIELTGFLLQEVYPQYSLTDLWLKGTFPEAFLLNDKEIQRIWYNAYLKTITERDLPQLGLKIPSGIVLKLIRMLASNQGGLFVISNLSKSLGISHNQTKEIINYLHASFLIRILEPFHTNIGKRLIKSPKIYIRDSGLFNYLLDIDEYNKLLGNHLAGNAWEGFCLEQIMNTFGDAFSYFFYRTQDQAECDMVIVKNNEPLCCIEIKLSLSPSKSKSFTTVIHDLKTRYNYIIIPECQESYPISENIKVTDLIKFMVELNNLQKNEILI